MINSIVENISISGCISKSKNPSSKQTDIRTLSGYWYTMSRWNFNHTDSCECITIPEELNIQTEFAITGITKENIYYFEPLLPKELLRVGITEREGIKLLGAVNEEGFTCGTIILRIVKGKPTEVMWLYVAEEARKKHCSYTLLSVGAELAREAKAGGLYFLVGEKKDGTGDEEAEGFLKKLHCSSQVVLENFVAIDLKEFITRFSEKQNYDNCFFIHEIPEELSENFLKEGKPEEVTRIRNVLKMMGSESIAEGFEKESCLIYEDGRVKGMLLFTGREDSRGISLVYMRAGDEKSLARMLGFAAFEAYENYGDYGLITFAALNGIGKAMGGLFKDEEKWIRVKNYLVGGKDNG